jgi:hypothetical protein
VFAIACVPRHTLPLAYSAPYVLAFFDMFFDIP